MVVDGMLLFLRLLSVTMLLSCGFIFIDNDVFFVVSFRCYRCYRHHGGYRCYRRYRYRYCYRCCRCVYHRYYRCFLCS